MRPTRRELIRAGAGVVAGAGMAGCAASVTGQSFETPPRGRPLRVAHLTDMHVQPERRATDGYIAALASLEDLAPRADLIVTGGDHIMDADQALDRCRAQWALYEKAIASVKEPPPVYPVLGNHDIYAWGLKDVSESTVGYGKAMALDRLKLSGRFYSFDAGGWHFVMLDSMSRRGRTYAGLIDPEQLEWLKADLASAAETKMPTIVFSHIPILCACVFFDGKERITPDADHWNVPDRWMHRDLRELLDLFENAANVKLLASGHIHLVDRVDYRGMTFLCNGAVSGNWWKGKCQQFGEGYGVIDLYPDGRFAHQYLTYGWTASPT